jgi:hypothetical protein
MMTKKFIVYERAKKRAVANVINNDDTIKRDYEHLDLNLTVIQSSYQTLRNHDSRGGIKIRYCTEALELLHHIFISCHANTQLKLFIYNAHHQNFPVSVEFSINFFWFF